MEGQEEEWAENQGRQVVRVSPVHLVAHHSHRKPRVGAVAIQQPFTAASTRGFALGRMKRWRRFRLGFRLGKVVIDTVPRSARRVSVGGWEVR